MTRMNQTLTTLTTPGQRIVWLREGRGMNQLELSKAVGVSQNAMSKIERGLSKAPSAATLMRLAAIFECSSKWIMDGKGHPFTQDSEEYRTAMDEVFAKLTPQQQSAILAAAMAMATS